MKNPFELKCGKNTSSKKAPQPIERTISDEAVDLGSGDSNSESEWDDNNDPRKDTLQSFFPYDHFVNELKTETARFATSIRKNSDISFKIKMAMPCEKTFMEEPDPTETKEADVRYKCLLCPARHFDRKSRLLAHMEKHSQKNS